MIQPYPISTMVGGAKTLVGDANTLVDIPDTKVFALKLLPARLKPWSLSWRPSSMELCRFFKNKTHLL
jgi:hypothetical protein